MTGTERNKWSFLDAQKCFYTNLNVCLHLFLLFSKASGWRWLQLEDQQQARCDLIKHHDCPVRPWGSCCFVPARSWRGDACLYTSPYTAPCFRDPSGHAWSLSTAHPPLPPSQPPGALTRKHGERTESRVVSGGGQSQGMQKKNGNWRKFNIGLLCSIRFAVYTHWELLASIASANLIVCGFKNSKQPAEFPTLKQYPCWGPLDINNTYNCNV